jgi:hypothetical protein
MSSRNRIHILIWIMLLGATLAIGVVWYQYAKRFNVISARHEDWGQAGDYFGGFLGAGLAFLALLALLWSVHIQKTELSATTAILKAQARELERQNVKDIFFRMLMLHNENTRALYLYDINGRREANGRAVIGFIAHAILSVGGAGISMPGLASRAQQTFESTYRTYSDSLGHYFRTLYSIFRFLKSSRDLNEQERNELAVIARAQISDAELVLLFFNCLTPQGAKFKSLVEEFRLFDNLREEQLADWTGLLPLYSATAYGPAISERVTSMTAAKGGETTNSSSES